MLSMILVSMEWLNFDPGVKLEESLIFQLGHEGVIHQMYSVHESLLLAELRAR